MINTDATVHFMVRETSSVPIWCVAGYYSFGGLGKPPGRSEWLAYDILYIYNRRKDII